MARKIADDKRAKIIADYLNHQNYKAVGMLNGVDRQTVKRIIDREPDVESQLRIKKEENIESMMQYLETKNKDMKEVLELLLDAMKFKSKNLDMFTSLKDIATAFAIIVDKSVMLEKNKASSGNDNQPLEIIVRRAENAQNIP